MLACLSKTNLLQIADLRLPTTRRRWNRYDIIGEYTGKVNSAEQVVEQERGAGHEEGYRLAISKCCATSPFINARTAGNETRFINDFRGEQVALLLAGPLCTYGQPNIAFLNSCFSSLERHPNELETLSPAGVAHRPNCTFSEACIEGLPVVNLVKLARYFEAAESL